MDMYGFSHGKKLNWLAVVILIDDGKFINNSKARKFKVKNKIIDCYQLLPRIVTQEV